MKLYCCTLLLLFCFTHSVFADDGVKIYQYKSLKGISSFSDIPPNTSTYQEIRIGCFACKLNSMVNWHNTQLFTAHFTSTINQQAQRYNIDPALIRAVIHAESHFDPRALSKTGAQGLMQLMPATAKELGIKNSFNAQQNIRAGSKHLARLIRKYGGNITLVSAAYNAGEGAVKKYKGVPPYPETQKYVERVKILHQRYLSNI
ncbi:lytic transglycosylase domain-containing protein [Colwellia sp. MB02u-14]|uniref:lytic transglycosylase domain-containing protein n=1 Tax=Colwellia sp. MB02u-14 TaxID=2759815 RepID=UPI0015F75DA2|nr:lytic transglycosylase domain-containing protein [Colwellia sp. MB02u-14]MBA6302217.1 lytic transglycosylase domain-containing protein [Colwellia sp. MB02u-14]